MRPAPLQARVKTQLRLSEATSALRQLSLTDSLTGVANRRRFDDVLHQEWRRARRAGNPLSLMMADVDHFKLYNDHYGHPASDACLRQVAQLLRSTSQRPGDLVARYGGEEFALLMPETDLQGALHVADLVIAAMAAAGLEHLRSPTARHVTVSLGLASIDLASPDWGRWTGRQPDAGAFDDAQVITLAADQALYAAKAGGRARAVLHGLGA